MLRSKSDTWHKKSSLDLALVRCFDGPQIRICVKCGSVNALVVGSVIVDVPFLLYVLEVSSQLGPSWVTLFVCKVLP